MGFLIDGSQTNLLPEICEALERIYAEQTSTKTVHLTSASELTEDQQFKLAKKLQQLTKSKNVVLSPRVDPDLEGGFVVEFDSYVLDFSVSGNYDRVVRGMLRRADAMFNGLPIYVPGSSMDPNASGEAAKKKEIEDEQRWLRENAKKLQENAEKQQETAEELQEAA